MARQRLLDLMQVYSFWLFDAGVPSALPVFSPVLGFSKITAPELTIEHKPIKPGNWYFPRNVVKRGGTSPITLERGCRFTDSEFYLWATGALRGRGMVRRNLVLVHFLGATLYPAGPPIGSMEFVRRIPGRAWGLMNCLPGKYVAGSDFNADSSEVSIQSLVVQPEMFQEMTISTVAASNPALFSVLRGGLAAIDILGATE